MLFTCKISQLGINIQMWDSSKVISLVQYINVILLNSKISIAAGHTSEWKVNLNLMKKMALI